MALRLDPHLAMSSRVSPALRMELSLLALPIDELKAEVKKELDSNPALKGSFPLVLPRMSGLTGANGFILDNARAKESVSLYDHIVSEMRMGGAEGRDLELVKAVACCLNEYGYFDGNYADIIMELAANEISVTEAELEEIRQKIMTLDPKGCGAENLEECFRAQLGRLPQAERGKVAALLPRLCAKAATPEELKYLKPLVAKLNPAPGKAFEYVKIDYVTPDILVNEKGEVQVDTADIPTLSVSQNYIEMAKDKSLDEETRAFAAEKVKRARDFSFALERRRETMEKIAEIAVCAQEEFLKKGRAAIKTLTMSEVAAKAGCVVSTVSRAAKRKFVRTPRGTFPLRDFFALKDRAPYEKLKEILSSLPKDRKVSDKEISEMMSAAGHPMARRTVAKWRKQFENICYT